MVKKLCDGFLFCVGCLYNMKQQRILVGTFILITCCSICWTFRSMHRYRTDFEQHVLRPPAQNSTCGSLSSSTVATGYFINYQLIKAVEYKLITNPISILQDLKFIPPKTKYRIPLTTRRRTVRHSFCYPKSSFGTKVRRKKNIRK